ncbi:MAG: PPC domain-containing protein [Planctomycetota bacterium]|jgi:hypothetical protein
MTRAKHDLSFISCLSLVLLAASYAAEVSAAPTPVLNSVFPAGGQAGTTVEVTIAGTGLADVSTLYCSQQGISCRKVDGGKNSFELSIPDETPVGQYDLYALTRDGLSSPRVFVVGNRSELLEADTNQPEATPQTVPLDATVNGQIQKGEIDRFSFPARKGQRIIIECLAERIDSSLRAVLEVFDSAGRRLAVNRGYFGIDPLIDFVPPRDGNYTVRLYDLVYSGSNDHYYRLDIDTGPRVAFAVPAVVQTGRENKVTLFGWNLDPSQVTADKRFDRLEVAVRVPPTGDASSSGLRLRSQQVTSDVFAYRLSDNHAPVPLGVTDVPVQVEASAASLEHPQELAVPSEVSGQLTGTAELKWFAFSAHRGEVLWLEALGERIGSPVDLDLTVLNESGDRELARFRDEVANLGGKRFSTSHSDPSGRFVVPAAGRYLVLLRNLIGGSGDDPRRVYRLSIRREEPQVHLAIVPPLDGPAGINLPLRGRTLLDVVAFRNRGLTGPIRVSADKLPAGVECPDIWLGPGVDRAPLILTSADDARAGVGTISFKADSEGIPKRNARGGVVVRHNQPMGCSRLTDSSVMAIAGESRVRLTANGHEPRDHHLFGELTVRHSPGGILDVAVSVERLDLDHQAPVSLIGVGVPDLIENQTSQIPAGQTRGYLSFYLPPTLPTGRYTIAVQGQTAVPVGKPDGKGGQKTQTVTVVSNPVTFEVSPPAFVVKVDPYNPRQIRRGEIVKVKYSARRINGFISKIHTELFSTTDKVDGLRGRGVTFVGQTDSGTIQIIANEDARLGSRPSLRLYAVGVVEDEAVYHGSCFLDLEVVE